MVSSSATEELTEHEPSVKTIAATVTESEVVEQPESMPHSVPQKHIRKTIHMSKITLFPIAIYS